MNQTTQIALVAHNIRSAHNIGSLLRLCDGLAVDRLYITGISPYPKHLGDKRLPHLAEKITRRIAKTSLGAEESVSWEYHESIEALIASLKRSGYTLIGLEQAPDATSLPEYRPAKKIALLLGQEVEGIDAELLRLCDLAVEIPMFGNKESYNVATAAAMTLYHFRFP